MKPKPCPFCKTKTPLVNYHSRFAYVKCSNPNCAAEIHGKTEEEAIQHWNVRLSVTSLEQEINCLEATKARLLTALKVITKIFAPTPLGTYQQMIATAEAAIKTEKDIQAHINATAPASR